MLYQIWTTPSFPRYHNKHMKFMKNIAVATQIWHGAKCSFTDSSNTWYLMTVPNMNKIKLFFSETTNTQTLWKSGNNYSNLVQSQMLFYKHGQCMVPNYCDKYEHNHNILLWDTTIKVQNLWGKMPQLLKFWIEPNYIFYVHQQTYRRTGPIPIFPDSPTAELWIIK